VCKLKATYYNTVGKVPEGIIMQLKVRYGKVVPKVGSIAGRRAPLGPDDRVLQPIIKASCGQFSNDAVL
jgi:hypothetical protein